MNKNFLLIALFVFGVSGCVAQHTVKNWSSIDAGPKPELDKIKKVVMEKIKYGTHLKNVTKKTVTGLTYVAEEKVRLTDPESAQFRNWTPLYKDILKWGASDPLVGVWRGCVSVNAKNRFGGYVGDKVYVYKIKDNEVIWTYRGSCQNKDYMNSSRLN